MRSFNKKSGFVNLFKPFKQIIYVLVKKAANIISIVVSSCNLHAVK